ncbi:MAG: cytochrome c peroxidase [Gammaproteobacteria bacterium]|jgi:cytochrome c peroxidase
MLIQNPMLKSRAGGILAASLLCIININSGLANEPTIESEQRPDIAIGSRNAWEPIRPIPDYIEFAPDKVALGEKLFQDKRLDSKKNIACGDCHNLELGGTDQLAFSVNGAGIPTQFNTPSIFNVALNTQYYWSGKFETLDEQITDAIKEINTTWPQLIRTIESIPEYSEQFNNLYPDGVTRENIKDVLLSFESSLLTPNSAFDQYLKGSATALSASELNGYKLFKSYGCTTCHQGINIGGNFVLRLDKLGAPFGNFNSTRGRLRGKIKQIRVPSLRNVALTAPYFHDGSATTLRQAVSRMLDEYLGISIKDQDVSQIVSFLKTLTGEYKGQKL